MKCELCGKIKDGWFFIKGNKGKCYDCYTGINNDDENEEETEQNEEEFEEEVAIHEIEKPTLKMMQELN